MADNELIQNFSFKYRTQSGQFISYILYICDGQWMEIVKNLKRCTRYVIVIIGHFSNEIKRKENKIEYMHTHSYINIAVSDCETCTFSKIQHIGILYACNEQNANAWMYVPIRKKKRKTLNKSKSTTRRDIECTKLATIKQTNTIVDTLVARATAL